MAVLKYLLNRRFLLVASALCASCIGANMVALALFLLVRPFSRSLYRRLVSQVTFPLPSNDLDPLPCTVF